MDAQCWGCDLCLCQGLGSGMLGQPTLKQMIMGWEKTCGDDVGE